MALTRTYQCPGCGRLIPTKRDPSKYLTCPDCRAKGAISKHSVSAPMTVARKKRAQQKAAETRAAREEAAPFTKDQLLGRIEMAKETEAKEETKDETYECQKCDQPVGKGQKFCPNCGEGLDWSGVG